MGILDFFEKRKINIEDAPWINIHIEIAVPKKKVSSHKKFLAEHSFDIGWNTYVERVNPDESHIVEGKKKKYSDYYLVGMEPIGMKISPKNLAPLLLHLRKIALSYFNMDRPNKKNIKTMAFTNFIQYINNKAIFAVLKNGLEITGELNKVIELEKNNPELSKKAFYFSIKDLYQNQKEVSKNTKESKEEREKAKKFMSTLEKEGYKE